MIRTATITLLLAALGTGLVHASELEDRILAHKGLVHLSCPARADTRGGQVTITIDDGKTEYHDEHDGLVHVVFEVADGRIEDLDLRCGGRPAARERRAVDLGQWPAAELAGLGIDLMRNHPDEDVREDAVALVAIADADNWRPLLELARDRDRAQDLRQAAIFWLGVGAGERMADELKGIATDDRERLEVREHAVFALSQALEDDPQRAVATLGEIATSHGHPEVRRSALFWLAQLDEPEVLDLFESILLE